MTVTHRRRLAAAVAATGAGALALGAASLPATALEIKPDRQEQGSEDEFNFVTTVVEPQSSGVEALSQLDSTNLKMVADRAGMTVQRLTSLLERDEAIVSPNGFVTLVDNWTPKDDHSGEGTDIDAASVPGDPVNGSRPGASNTVFIDFDGHTIEDTEWNYAFGVDSIEIGAYDADDDFKYAVWERIAQDYAPFDVNVTISDPGPDALFKGSADDDAYGSHLVILPDSSVLPASLQGAGGWGFIGAFGSEYLSPAMVLADNLHDNEYFIADAGSHEVGHNLGLEHHGIGTEEYYYGETQASPHALWGPIMGAPYTVPLSHWSDGGYAGATNSGQDDIAVITDGDAAQRYVLLYDQDGNTWTEGACFIGDDPNNPQPGDEFYEPNDNGGCDPLGPRLVDRWEYMDRTQLASDPHGDTTDAATALDNSGTDFAAEGNIVSSGDVDVFSFATSGGAFTATAAPAGAGANLDIKLTLLDGEGEVLAENEQDTTVDPVGGPFSPAALGLDASIDQELEAGTYYLTVEGRGQGDPADNTPENGCCYTDYSSLGFYQLTGSAEPLDVTPVVISSPEDGAEVASSDLRVEGTAEADAEVTLTIDGETVGTAEVDAEGSWATTLESDLPYGASTITAQQTVGGLTIPQTDSVTVTVPLEAPVITKPEDGDTANTATPRFLGTGIAGATVTVSIACGEDFAHTEDAAEGVNAEGAWSFVPSEGLPNGDCTVEAVQSIGDVASPASAQVSFAVDANGGGDEDGDDGTEEGDEDGTDLPDTGSSSMTVLVAGLALLTLGGLLYARTRRSTV